MIILEGLSLPCPCNRLHTPLRVGRFTKMVLSKEAREKRKRLLHEILGKLGGFGPLWHGAQVHLTWWPASKRCCDHDAYTKQTLDVLQEARVVADDKHIHCSKVERMPERHPDYPRGCLRIEVSRVD
jgi:Holliday junction resolvase RusA-like endonuclease